MPNGSNGSNGSPAGMGMEGSHTRFTERGALNQAGCYEERL